ncbi:MAG: glycosyltransferase [Candidatus Altiarchaeota archaeon]
MPNISVIIPTKNEEAEIKQCLESIKSQTYRDFDIWVVDAYSTDKTEEIAKEYTKNVIKTKAKFPGQARNEGVKKCDSKIVAFIDADTIAPKDWLERIAKDFSERDIVALGGVLRPLNPRLLDKIMFKINSDLWYRLTAKFGFYQLPTPNCAYKREIFLKANGFNEEMSMLEDTELSLRIKKYGKVFIDKNLYTLNSTRRFRQEGYFKVFCRYLIAYTNMFLGRKVKSRHFDVIEHEEQV